MAQVPALSFTDSSGASHTVTQSLAIISFLDAAHPKNAPIVPSDPVQRAKAMEIAEIINAGVQPLQNLGTTKAIQAFAPKAHALDFAAEAIQKGLAACERLVAVSEGRF